MFNLVVGAKHSGDRVSVVVRKAHLTQRVTAVLLIMVSNNLLIQFCVTCILRDIGILYIQFLLSKIARKKFFGGLQKLKLNLI